MDCKFTGASLLCSCEMWLCSQGGQNNENIRRYDHSSSGTGFTWGSLESTPPVHPVSFACERRGMWHHYFTSKFKFTCENSQSHMLECGIHRPISCEYMSPIFYFFSWVETKSTYENIQFTSEICVFTCKRAYVGKGCHEFVIGPSRYQMLTR